VKKEGPPNQADVESIHSVQVEGNVADKREWDKQREKVGGKSREKIFNGVYGDPRPGDGGLESMVVGVRKTVHWLRVQDEVKDIEPGIPYEKVHRNGKCPIQHCPWTHNPMGSPRVRQNVDVRTHYAPLFVGYCDACHHRRSETQ